MTTATSKPSEGHLWWFYAALVLLGTYIGLSIGLSASPVIAVVVPLLFSLIAGGSGFYAARSDLTQQAGRRKANQLGCMLIFFTAPILIASIYGVLVRTGADFAAFWPFFKERRVESAYSLTPQDIQAQGLDGALEIAALRYRLRHLGASEDEISTMEKFALSSAVTPATVASVAAAFREISIKAAQSRETMTDDIVKKIPANKIQNLDSVLNQLIFIRDQYAFYSQQLERNPKTSFRPMLVRLQEDAHRMTDMIHDRFDTIDWLINVPELQHRLWDLELTFFADVAQFGGVDWMSGGRISEQVDKLISASGGSAPSGGGGDQELHPSFAP